MSLEDLLEPGATLERIGSGFGFTEGPVWNVGGGYLVFSDLEQDVRRRWDPRSGFVEVARPTNHTNGMTYDREGRLLACEHATSLVVRHELDGGRTVLASHYEGRELNSPNDIVVRSDGAIYFTDPGYGRTNDVHGITRAQELDFQGVFRLAPEGGEPQLLVDDFAMPNGLAFGPGESVLYVDDTDLMHVRRFEVRPDGTLGGGDVWFEEHGDPADGFPDGLKVDERGNVWVCGPGGIWMIDPTGDFLGVIETPEIAANLTWGGGDLRTLFVTATTGLYAIRTSVGPYLVPHLL